GDCRSPTTEQSITLPVPVAPEHRPARSTIHEDAVPSRGVDRIRRVWPGNNRPLIHEQRALLLHTQFPTGPPREHHLTPAVLVSIGGHQNRVGGASLKPTQ